MLTALRVFSFSLFIFVILIIMIFVSILELILSPLDIQIVNPTIIGSQILDKYDLASDVLNDNLEVLWIILVSVTAFSLIEALYKGGFISKFKRGLYFLANISNMRLENIRKEKQVRKSEKTNEYQPRAELKTGFQLSDVKRHKKYIIYFFIPRTVTISLLCFLVLYPHTLYDLPLGGDTLFYSYIINTMEKEGIDWALSYTDRPLFYSVLFILKEWSGLSMANLFAGMSLFLSIMYMMSLWLFTKGLTRNEKLTSLALLFAALSPLTFRYNIDLYNSFLGLSLMLLFFYILLRNHSLKSYRNTILLSSFSIVILFTYWYYLPFVAAIGMMIRYKEIIRMIIIFLPSFIILSTLSVVAIYNSDYYGLGYQGTIILGINPDSKSIIPTETSSTSFYPPWVDLRIFMTSENILIFLLALVGIVSISRYPMSNQSKVCLYALTSIFVSLAMIPSFATHASLSFPSAILAALGVYGTRKLLLERARKVLQIHAYSEALLRYAVLSIIILIGINAGIQYQQYFTPLFPPNDDGLLQLQWIRDQYGYGNNKVIVVANDFYNYMWILSTVGGPDYFGKVASLLDDRTTAYPNAPFMRHFYLGSLQNMESRGVPLKIDTAEYTILVPTDLYSPDIIERAFLEPVGPGVLKVKSMTEDERSLLLYTWKIYFSDKSQDPNIKSFSLDAADSFNNWLNPNDPLIVSATLDPINKVEGNASIRVDITNIGDSTRYIHLFNPQGWNFANTSYIEFDIKLNSHTHPTDTELYVLLQSELYFQDYLYIEYSNQIIRPEGWSRIKIPLNKFDGKGLPLLEEIHYISFGIWSEQDDIGFNIDNIRGG